MLFRSFLTTPQAQKSKLSAGILRKSFTGRTYLVSFDRWTTRERDVFNGWLLEQNAYLIRENKVYYIDFYEEEYASLFLMKHL